MRRGGKRAHKNSNHKCCHPKEQKIGKNGVPRDIQTTELCCGSERHCVCAAGDIGKRKILCGQFSMQLSAELILVTERMIKIKKSYK
mmetsp:Transcript_3993/g.10103  ORF Transcript_3993/g.10103 Transcript_3993/m.10103 type:complete len:87 (-) Transcript_3993:22-282(-)